MEAISLIKALKLSLEYFLFLKSGRIFTSISLKFKLITNLSLKYLSQFQPLQSFVYDDKLLRMLSEQTLSSALSLRTLKLYLKKTLVNGEGLQSLLQNLRGVEIFVLHLDHTLITDEGIGLDLDKKMKIHTSLKELIVSL